VLVELGLESFEQRKSIRRAAGETGEYFVVMQAPHFARARLDHDIAERDLAVAAERDTLSAPHREDGRTVKDFVIHGKSVPGRVDRVLPARRARRTVTASS
jgi:hypothetical protein